jgi:hypothetical protein
MQISEAISSHLHLTTSIKKSTKFQVFIYIKNPWNQKENYEN